MRYWDFADFLLTIFVVLIIALLILVPYAEVRSQQIKCHQLDETSINHEWTFWTGCRAQRPNGMWVAVDDYYILEGIFGE
jgi:hypothetical protein